MKWRPAGLIVVGLLVVGIAVWIPFDTGIELCPERQTISVAMPWEELRAQSRRIEYRELLQRSEHLVGQCFHFIHAVSLHFIGRRGNDYEHLVRVGLSIGQDVALVGPGVPRKECGPFQLIAVAEGLSEWVSPSSGQRIPRLKTIAINDGPCFSHGDGH